MESSVLIKNIRAVDPEKDIRTDVLILNDRIEAVGNIGGRRAETVIDGAGLVLMPSLFDMHVHFRDPGYTYKEDILSGCSAALAGGVTGVMCMPNTSPPCDNPDIVEYIRGKAAGTGVDVYPAGCITKGMKGLELCDFKKLRSAGCLCVSDDGRPVINAGIMEKALKECYREGLLVISHCEDPDIIGGGIMNKGKISEKLGVRGMDRTSEDCMTARELVLAADTKTRIHIAHVSTATSVGMIRTAKKYGINVTCETAPHYFMLTDKLLESRDADYRMNPPLRTQEDVDAVIGAVKDGTIDCIITDHAPHTQDEKADFESAPNGVIGLETSLAATLTGLYHKDLVSLSDIVRLMCVNPRKILGLETPSIDPGKPADLVIADLNRKWTVDTGKFRSKSRNSVFKGMTLTGKPVMTISKGKIRFDER